MSTFAVALTGGIASGKSTVAELFAARGVAIVDTDIGAREVVVPGSAGLAAVTAAFGSEILDADGGLNRRALRQRVFADAAERRRLEAITHPLIRTWARTGAANATSAYVLVVVPLLAETWDAWRWVGRVLLVEADRTTRIARLMARDAIDRAGAERMLAAQADDAARRAIADDVIVNDGDRASLDAAVDALHQRYLALATSA